MVKRQRKHLQRRSRVFGADPQPSDYHNHQHPHSPQMPKLNAAVRSFSSDGGNVMHRAKGNGTPHIGQVVSGYDGHAVRLAPGFGDLEVWRRHSARTPSVRGLLYVRLAALGGWPRSEQPAQCDGEAGEPCGRGQDSDGYGGLPYAVYGEPRGCYDADEAQDERQDDSHAFEDRLVGY